MPPLLLLPFRAFHAIPTSTCASLACLLEAPVARQVVVRDAADVAYAWDLQLTDSFYFAVLAFALMQWVVARTKS